MESIETRLAKYSFISGIAGFAVITLIGILAPLCYVYFKDSDLIRNGFSAGSALTVLGPLATCGIIMFLIEIIIRYKVDRQFFIMSEKIKKREYASFVMECVINYGMDLILLYSVILFYRYSNEYAFQRNSSYYDVWFSVLDVFWKVFIYSALPCIVITRFFNHDANGDRKKASYLAFKTIIRLFPFLHIDRILLKINYFNIREDDSLYKYTDVDKKTLLGMMVKIFYIPLMTVFFSGNFSSFIKNISNFKGFVRDGLSAKEFLDTTLTWIFSVDVALGWCGYVVSSRWIKNANVSVETTFLGWAVAIICYRPFNSLLNTYFNVPSEHGFLSIPNGYLVWLFAIMSVASYIVYMSATLVFGLRFSNLTNRGIITKGAYRFVRHPAYAAKNFSWWCVMMPYVVYESFFQNHTAMFMQITALMGMTLLYYFRARTEERHLSQDPDYIAYCEKVPYRFIPGVI